jgi:hypothetical protein
VTHIPGLGLGATLLLASSLASAMPLAVAMAEAHRCTTDTSWAEQVGPDDWTPVCGDAFGYPTGIEPRPATEAGLCGLYAQWAVWSCEHGYPTDSDSCSDAADLALEECGSWQ